MAIQLKQETKTWRVDSENEAVDMINDFKAQQLSESYTIAKSSYTLKTKKSKGEVVDSWYIVSVTFDYEV